ncbi:MAG: 2-hydroxyacyl-CoA dehydratase family protein [Oscillospiraceae bacterium]|nr:2-hydroxyacyl-CoA dehydratase family protein [Oscillospiraceae bacterium]
MQIKPDTSLLSVEERRQERFVNKSAAVAAKYLRRMEDMSGLPDSMRPFLDVLRDIYINFGDVKRPEGVKTIGTYCVMVPQELTYAFGAVAVKLCSGNFTAFAVGDDITPRDACPLVKAIAGIGDIRKLPLYDNCSLMVVPITCDCKKKLVSMLAEYTKVHILPVPSSRQGDDVKERFLEELYALLPAFEEATGNKLTYDSLTRGVAAVGRAQAQFWRFMKFRREAVSVIRGTHAMAVMNALSYMPIDDWTDALVALNNELDERVASGYKISQRKQPRIMLTGSPVIFPNIKVPMLIDEMGGALIADETCMGDRFMYDPLVVTDPSFDGIMRAMANRYIRPCSCPTFVDVSTRIYRLKQMVKDNNVEGVIYHVLRGCMVYDFEYNIVERELAKDGIPVIRVESDYNEEDIEQLRIRTEAFIELLKFSRPAKEKK